MKKIIYLSLTVLLIFAGCEKNDDVVSYVKVYGCTDSSAFNFNLSANVYDNTCCYYAGCMDVLAVNYNPNVCYDDGSCLYTLVIYGCMDPSALNYDPTATVDDGSCAYQTFFQCDGSGWCEESASGGYPSFNECMINCVK